MGGRPAMVQLAVLRGACARADSPDRVILYQNLATRFYGYAHVNGFDRLHNLHLGVIPKVLESLQETLLKGNLGAEAGRWQVTYLEYLALYGRFAGLRVFPSLHSKRNFDD